MILENKKEKENCKMTKLGKCLLVGSGVGIIAGVVGFFLYRSKQFDDFYDFDDYEDDYEDDDYDEEISDEFDMQTKERYTELSRTKDSEEDVSLHTDPDDFDCCDNLDEDYSGTRFKQVTGVSREDACSQIVDASMGTLTVNELLVLSNDELAETYSKFKVK